MTNSWSAGASYSYLRAKRNDGLGGPDYDADQHRHHVFSLFGAWEPNDAWAFSAKWKYASGRPDDAFVVNADVFDDPDFLRYSKEITTKNTRRFPALHTLNIRVDYRRRLGPVSLIAFVDVINVYGRENVDSRGFDERRGVDVENGFEVLPNLGVKFEYAWTPRR
jgi:outer membrane receptor protein involved in Fe transport